MRAIVGAFDGLDTRRGREGAYPDRPLHPFSLCVGRTHGSGMGGDEIVFRKGYMNMDGEDRQNTADLNRSTLYLSIWWICGIKKKKPDLIFGQNMLIDEAWHLFGSKMVVSDMAQRYWEIFHSK